MHLQQTAFENIAGKEEIACNKQFLLFPQCFLVNQKIVSPFVNIYEIISLFAAEMEAQNWHVRYRVKEKTIRLGKNYMPPIYQCGRIKILTCLK